MPILPRHHSAGPIARCSFWAGLLCCGVLFAEPAFPADPATEDPLNSATAGTEDTQALLQQVEDQVLRGQMLSPPDDNAFQTWERVLARVSSGAPDQLQLLGRFLVHIRQKIQSEQAAGNISRSVELMLFADQAERILGSDQPQTAQQPAPVRSPPPTPETPAPPSRPPAPAESPAAPIQSAAKPVAPPPARNNPPEESTSPSAPVVAALKPPSIAPQIDAPTRPPAVNQSPRDNAAAATYTAKGDALLAIKDISAARKFYEYGANAGGSRAALALARTYDPTYIPQLGAIGLAPDRALAETWYRRAAELGETSADNALQKLKAAR